jgi:hypothetical protein
LPVVAHGGALFGYRAELLRFPKQRFSVICLCNLSTADPGKKAYRIADIYLVGKFTAPAKPTPTHDRTDLDQSPPAHLSAAELAGYSGDFYSSELLATYRIHLSNGKLSLTVGRSEPIELRPGAHDRFRANLAGEFREPITIQFKRDNGRLAGFDLFAGAADGVRNIGFIRQ